MDVYEDQVLDSPSKNSYIGSYYQPPDRTKASPRWLELPKLTVDQMPRTKPDGDNKAVVDALKNLQEKMKQLELERKQAQKKYRQFSHKHRQSTAAHAMHVQAASSLPENGNANQKELYSKLQTAESSCRILEKQLDYMRKMIEIAKTEKNSSMENQEQQPSSSDSHAQWEKLDKLESECLKLSRTQTVSEMKLATLEQKLLKEEHERKLLEEKARVLQRELDLSLQLSSPAPAFEEVKTKKKTKKKPPRYNELTSPAGASLNKLPFVAGTSTSPSHSVHANVQGILHMMKHHQPQLCERISALQTAACGARKNLHRDLDVLPTASCRCNREPDEAAPTLGSLSDLILALQDELGQMSFQHQDLVRQNDAAQHVEQRLDLQRELQRLNSRIEEKGSQIMKLRKHQQTVHKLTHSSSLPPCAGEVKRLSWIKSPHQPPVKTKQKARRAAASHKNLRILRDTRKLRTSLRQDDLSWET